MLYFFSSNLNILKSIQKNILFSMHEILILLYFFKNTF
nr:MAG TPA: hypothetical protein [Caudoviricetes sp.]